MKEYIFNYGKNNNEYLHVIIKNGSKEDWYDELGTRSIMEYDEESGEEYEVGSWYSEDINGKATLFIDSYYAYPSKGGVISHILQILIHLSIQSELKTTPSLTVESNLNEFLKSTKQNLFQAITEIVDEF
jgi:hypothetical protein